MSANPKILIAMAAFCFLLGLLQVGCGIIHRNPKAVSLSELETGEQSVPWNITFVGQPRWDLAVRYEHQQIVPVVSDKWTPGQPVVILFEVLDRDGPADRSADAKITGFRVIGRGIGVKVRDYLEGQQTPPGKNAVFISQNRTSWSIIKEGLMFIGGSFLLLLIYAPLQILYRAVFSIPQSGASPPN